MVRGTTPIITITFPQSVTVSDITKFNMYFLQGKDTIITRTEANLTIDGQSVSALLTQEETFLFSPKKRLEIKSRYKFSNGTVGATMPKFLEVYDTGGDTDTIL